MYWVLFLGIICLTASIFHRQKIYLWAVTLASFAYFFEGWGQGLMPFIVFSLGAVLVVLEFYLPHAGFAGIVGALTMAVGLFWRLNNFVVSALLMLGFGLISVGTLWFYAKLGRTIQVNPSLILHTKSKAPIATQHPALSVQLVNQIGVAVVDLKPVGRIEMAGERYDAVSQDGLIRQGEAVRVVAVDGSKVIVKKEGKENV